MKPLTLIISLVIFSIYIPSISKANTLFTLEQAVEQSRTNSKALKAAKLNSKAALLNAEASNSTHYPKLSLDGTYKTLSLVPEVNIGPNAIQLSDTHTYSIGPTLSYTLFDAGLKKHKTDSLGFIAKIKQDKVLLTESQLKLSTQLAYIQTALTANTLYSAMQSRELSQTQNKDILNRFRSGAASRLDALNSDTEILNYQLKVEQTQTEFTTSFAELKYLTGGANLNSSDLESLDEILGRLKNLKPLIKVNKLHPLIQIQENVEKASLTESEIQKAANWPIINLQLRSSLDYPNGPKFEQINQNSVGLNLTWSLFEFGSTQKQISAKNVEAQSALELKKDIEETLTRDIEKTNLKLASLKTQIEESQQILSKQQEIAHLNFSTYTIGKLSFSEVQTANLRLLESRNRLSQLKAQYLIQFFNLQFLTESESL